MRLNKKRFSSFFKRFQLPKIVLDLTSVQVGDIGTSKIRKEKLLKFLKILNYNNSSCIIFYLKMYCYPRYIYHSQKELKHFGLEMSLVYGVLGHFEFKIYKDF